MKWHVEYSEADIQALTNLVKMQENHPFFLERKQRNASQKPMVFDEEEVWLASIMCLVTTQNKSGQGSYVDKFLFQENFPLTLVVLRKTDNVQDFIRETLSNQSLRLWERCARFAFHNFQVLEDGMWAYLRGIYQQLNDQKTQAPQPKHYLAERFAAQTIQKNLMGMGPKQSRNFWQFLGLTRYEIPIDSRINRWFSAHLGFHMPGAALQDEDFSCLILDSIRDLCRRTHILPCLLDAAIFSSYEK